MPDDGRHWDDRGNCPQISVDTNLLNPLTCSHFRILSATCEDFLIPSDWLLPDVLDRCCGNRDVLNFLFLLHSPRDGKNAPDCVKTSSSLMPFPISQIVRLLRRRCNWDRTSPILSKENWSSTNRSWGCNKSVSGPEHQKEDCLLVPATMTSIYWSS